MEPVSIAALPVRSQTSRATSGVNRSPAGRPINFNVSRIFRSETRSETAIAPSCTESPCFSASSKTLSPVWWSKSAMTMVSLSVSLAGRCETKYHAASPRYKQDAQRRQPGQSLSCG